jgi:hypothetical protein
MLKYVEVLTFSLTLFATTAISQVGPAPVAQVQRLVPVGPAPMNNILYTDAGQRVEQPRGPQQQAEQAQMARLLAERDAQLRLDTLKLVALTAELKEHVDKTGINILSMDVIKKAREIEKLAKSVQDKMRHAY